MTGGCPSTSTSRRSSWPKSGSAATSASACGSLTSARQSSTPSSQYAHSAASSAFGSSGGGHTKTGAGSAYRCATAVTRRLATATASTSNTAEAEASSLG